MLNSVSVFECYTELVYRLDCDLCFPLVATRGSSRWSHTKKNLNFLVVSNKHFNYFDKLKCVNCKLTMLQASMWY